MVLAAGLGSRLRPLTNTLPKPLLPIANRPILEYTFALLARAGLGVEDVVVNAHHLPERLEDGLRSLDTRSLRVHLSREPRILGTAGGPKKARPLLESGTFLLVNGDFLIDIDLRDVVAFHRRSDARATMVLREDEEGGVFVDREGRIRKVLGSQEETPPDWTRADFTGIHVLEPEVLKLIPRNTPYEINLQVYPEMLRRGWTVAGLLHRGYWREAGDPARYLAANREVISGRAGGIAPPPGAGRLNPEETGWTSPLLVGEGAVIEAGARLGPGVVVGPEVHIGRGATVENAVLLEGTDIPAGARVENEIRSPDSVLSAL
jgi:mannose-1-phosphate guanylyltransferase